MKRLDIDIDRLKPLDGIRDCLLISRAVEPAGRRDFAGEFGNERHLIRYHVERDADHFFRRRHFDIQLRLDGFPQNLHIAMLNMPAVAPQMHRDAVRSCQLADAAAATGSGSFVRLASRIVAM